MLQTAGEVAQEPFGLGRVVKKAARPAATAAAQTFLTPAWRLSSSRSVMLRPLCIVPGSAGGPPPARRSAGSPSRAPWRRRRCRAEAVRDRDRARSELSSMACTVAAFNGPSRRSAEAQHVLRAAGVDADRRHHQVIADMEPVDLEHHEIEIVERARQPGLQLASRQSHSDETARDRRLARLRHPMPPADRRPHRPAGAPRGHTCGSRR